MRGLRYVVVFVVIILQVSNALADSLPPMIPHVVAGKGGSCYVKSTPIYDAKSKKNYQTQGRTIVYKVGKYEDILVHSYDWFSRNVYVACGNVVEGSYGIGVVRSGPLNDGNKPDREHLALAFYFDGKLVKSYSTLDIAGDSKNVRASLSHYEVFKQDIELVWNGSWKNFEEGSGAYYSEKPVMKALTVDGRELIFDLATGEIIETIKSK